jgi:iron complex transport system ATP-binding protein
VTPRPDGLRLDGLSVGYRVARRVVRLPAPGVAGGRRAGDRVVLAGLGAVARRGELTVLLGPNGVGKSTLLRTLAGLLPPLGGGMLLEDEDLARLRVDERARRVAVVLTDRVQAGLLSAWELVALGRHPHTPMSGKLAAADVAVVGWALAAAGAAALADRPVAELSDGERQRLLTARALAQEPSLMLLDEPTAFLDAPSRVALTGLLRRLARERDMTVVASTHDLELALRVADHVWLLDRDRRLHTGTPEEVTGRGEVAAAFDTDELAFDRSTGTFVLREDAGSPPPGRAAAEG